MRQERKRGIPSSGSLPRWTEWPGLNQSQELLLMGGRGPNTWTVLYWFSQLISKELDQKWNSRGLNQHPDGILLHTTTSAHSCRFLAIIVECGREVTEE